MVNILDECCVEAGKWEQENAENDEASMIEFLKDKGVEWNDVDIDASQRLVLRFMTGS